MVLAAVGTMPGSEARPPVSSRGTEISNPSDEPLVRQEILAGDEAQTRGPAPGGPARRPLRREAKKNERTTPCAAGTRHRNVAFRLVLSGGGHLLRPGRSGLSTMSNSGRRWAGAASVG